MLHYRKKEAEDCWKTWRRENIQWNNEDRDEKRLLQIRLLKTDDRSYICYNKKMVLAPNYIRTKCIHTKTPLESDRRWARKGEMCIQRKTYMYTSLDDCPWCITFKASLINFTVFFRRFIHVVAGNDTCTWVIISCLLICLFIWLVMIGCLDLKKRVRINSYCLQQQTESWCSLEIVLFF